jgi:hypothetical protein
LLRVWQPFGTKSRQQNLSSWREPPLRADAAESVVDDAEEFRNRIGRQQKSDALRDVRCWPPSPFAFSPFETGKRLTCRFATENVASGVARIPDPSG